LLDTFNHGEEYATSSRRGAMQPQLPGERMAPVAVIEGLIDRLGEPEARFDVTLAALQEAMNTLTAPECARSSGSS
jgi:hypothetical protein